MNTHILNTSIFTIRTKQNVISEVTGIKNAIAEVEKLNNFNGVAVFFNEGSLNAKTFYAWAKNINKLINK